MDQDVNKVFFNESPFNLNVSTQYLGLTAFFKTINHINLSPSSANTGSPGAPRYLARLT